jgi:hypothetical protein
VCHMRRRIQTTVSSLSVRKKLRFDRKRGDFLTLDIDMKPPKQWASLKPPPKQWASLNGLIVAESHVTLDRTPPKEGASLDGLMFAESLLLPLHSSGCFE